jgi:hypothetical protein
MCHHLRRVHLSPLPQGCGLQAVYAYDHFVNSALLKQVFHCHPSQPVLTLETAAILHRLTRSGRLGKGNGRSL